MIDIIIKNSRSEVYIHESNTCPERNNSHKFSSTQHAVTLDLEKLFLFFTQTISTRTQSVANDYIDGV